MDTIRKLPASDGAEWLLGGFALLRRAPLALGARVVGTGLARLIVQTWLTTEFEGGRHARRVGLITDLEHPSLPS